jgi:hypothetical protein
MEVAALASALAVQPRQTADATTSRLRRRKHQPGREREEHLEPRPHDQHRQLPERPEQDVPTLVHGDVEIHEYRGLVVPHECEPAPHRDQAQRTGCPGDGQPPLDVVRKMDGAAGVHREIHRHRWARR